MLNKSIFFILLAFSSLCAAQMDTEHWFAPMKSNYPAGSNHFEAVYLSTSETTAFDVQIFSGEDLLTTVSLKKGSPVIYKVPRANIITEDNEDCSTVLQNKGLHLIGTKKYFATLRFSVTNHAEIVTSKGRAALGNVFYLGMPKYSLDTSVSSNHVVSLIATENGTEVSLTGYNEALKFTNDSTVSTSKTIILNKGECAIFEVNFEVRPDGDIINPYPDALIGAKITSTKPVSVTSGIFSGRIASDGVDIFMDQSVPVEKTGNDFIVMGGNGNFPDSDIESSLIIATEDNTEIYLNGSSTPAYIIAKAGGYYFADSRLYTPLDMHNNIFALHINTNKNVYVYQILAGSKSNERPSGGMNLIPALSCFLPSKIDEISAVSNLPTHIPSPSSLDIPDHESVKLNILAQRGSNLLINGSNTSILGPFPIPNSDWEVYSKLNVSGNQVIETTNNKAITAGIAGGSGPAGFGGYFAGFSSIPSVNKRGDCARGQLLEVDDFYDEYKWEYSSDNSNWGALPIITYFVDPGIKFGYYRAIVTKLSCLPSQMTKEFKYLKCPEQTTKSFDIGACQSINPIEPVFSKDASLFVNTSKTAIISQPAGGVAHVTSDGKVHYDAQNTALTQVTFRYYIEQAGVDFPEYEEVTVTVNIAQIGTINTEITECVDRTGQGIYDLKASFIRANSGLSGSHEYYTTQDFRPTTKIQTPSAYSSLPNQTVYVRVQNTYACDNRLNPAKITLKTFELPIITKVDVKGTSEADVYIEKGQRPYAIALKEGKLPLYEPSASEYQPVIGDIATLQLPKKGGFYTIYVRSADNCLPVVKFLAAVSIPNVITPNGDQLNATIDGSVLLDKITPVFKIFDRYGKIVFEGSISNNFTWDGTARGVALPTATYWYYSQWMDFEGTTPDILQGWIFLKNRD